MTLNLELAAAMATVVISALGWSALQRGHRRLADAAATVVLLLSAVLVFLLLSGTGVRN